MEEKEKVEKLNAKFVNSNERNAPFLKYSLIFIGTILLVFLLYLALAIFLITFGIIQIHQNIWGGDLFNGSDSIAWGTVCFFIGFLMLSPIIKYFRKLWFFIKLSYDTKKELKKGINNEI